MSEPEPPADPRPTTPTPVPEELPGRPDAPTEVPGTPPAHPQPTPPTATA